MYHIRYVFKYSGPGLARTLESLEFLSPKYMTWLDPRRTQKQENWKGKSCDQWLTYQKNLKNSQDTKHSDTLIRHLCHTATAVSSEYTIGEVKFRALIEDGKDTLEY